MDFSICLETFFPELPFADRLSLVAGAGFKQVEFWGSGDKDIEKIAQQCQELDLKVAAFSGHRQGCLLTKRGAEVCLADFSKTIAVAHQLQCPHLMVLTDELTGDGSVKEHYGEVEKDSYPLLVENLSKMAAIAQKENITLILEPLNTLIDHPGYYLNSSAQAFKLVEEVGSNHLRVLYDIYHMQVMEGNLIQTMEDNLDKIGYLHIADVPGRHEPGTGEINYPNILKALRSLKYSGTVGFECFPKTNSHQALATICRLTQGLTD